MKICISFLILFLSSAFAVSPWNAFSRTTEFYEAIIANRTLIMATDGGVRFIYTNGSSEVYSSEDGLESSEI